MPTGGGSYCVLLEERRRAETLEVLDGGIAVGVGNRGFSGSLILRPIKAMVTWVAELGHASISDAESWMGLLLLLRRTFGWGFYGDAGSGAVNSISRAKGERLVCASTRMRVRHSFASPETAELQLCHQLLLLYIQLSKTLYTSCLDNMLSIRSSSKERKCTPNLLPARLNHDGLINDTQRYWTPEKDNEGRHIPSRNLKRNNLISHGAGTSHAYFRGRHLYGTSIALPENYTGAILHVTDKPLPPKRDAKESAEEDDEDETEKVDVMIAERQGTFDEVMVWGHGGVVDEKEDAYVRGIKEWIGFAEAMHEEEDAERGSNKAS